MLLPLLFQNKLHQKRLPSLFKFLVRGWCNSNTFNCTYSYLYSTTYSIYSNKKSQNCIVHQQLQQYQKFCNFCTLHKHLEMENAENSGLSLNDVITKLDHFAPKSLAESWDNVGLLVEPISKKNVKMILLTNDLTEDVMSEAVKLCADLIISYHPPIFAPLKSITGRSWKERIIATCLENKIAVYSPHTSFDAISGGVNDWLASAFKTKSVTPLIQTYAADSRSKPYTVEITSSISDASKTGIILQKIQHDVKSTEGTNEELVGDIAVSSADQKLSISCSKSSLPQLAEIFHRHVVDADREIFRVLKYENSPLPGVGMGRLCCLEKPLQLREVIELVKKHIQIQHVRLALARCRNLESPVSTIALCAGSGSSVLRGIKADLYLTGEMQHHDVLDAVHKGSHVILCDHSNSERGFLKEFVRKLSVELLGGNVQVVMSKVDRDPLEIV